MISKAIRLGLTAILIGWGIYQFVLGNIGNGIFLILLSGIPLLSYFRNERILLALWHMRSNKLDKAEKSLLGIRNPEQSLIKSQLAYYYLLTGMIESQRGVGKAETILKKALNTGLRLKQDQALAKLSLAGIAISKGRKKEATVLLADVKRLDEKGVLDEQVKFIKQQMKKVGGPQQMRRKF
jgi:TM2 domain-containing membrane protein YozV